MNVNRFQLLFLSFFVMIVISCNIMPEPSNQNIIEMMTLIAYDTIGVDIGNDEEMFGNIVDVCILQDGSIVVADDQRLRISRFSKNGDFIQFISNHGNGPEEFQWIGGVFSLGEGFAIYEYYYPLGCLLVDGEMNVVDKIIFDEHGSIYNLTSLSDTTAVGRAPFLSSDPSSGEICIGIDICEWSLISGERKRVFYSNECITNRNTAYISYVNFESALAVSSKDWLFLAPNREENKVIIYSVNANQSDTLFLEYSTAMRDSVEMNLELEWRKMRDGRIGDWLPSNEIGIIQMFTQNKLQRVWYSHSSYSETMFDVFDYDGNQLFTCNVEGIPSEELYYFEICDDGYLAYTIAPNDYPKIYLLKME